MRLDFSINNKNSTNLINKKTNESLNDFALILHPDYTNIHVALTNAQNILSKTSIHKHEASKNLLFVIDDLLKQSKINLTDLSFLSAQIGPGPFTTLRVVLSTLNGLAYATKLPLIGVDGLDAFIKDQETIFKKDLDRKEEFKQRYLIIILNAFCNDVYFAIYDRFEKTTLKGCTSINNFIIKLEDLFKNSSEKLKSKEFAICVGNGLLLHQKTLIEKFNSQIFIPENFQEICSLDSVRILAYENYKNKNFYNQLLPIYLKESSSHLIPSVS